MPLVTGPELLNILDGVSSPWGCLKGAHISFNDGSSGIVTEVIIRKGQDGPLVSVVTSAGTKNYNAAAFRSGRINEIDVSDMAWVGISEGAKEAQSIKEATTAAKELHEERQRLEKERIRLEHRNRLEREKQEWHDQYWSHVPAGIDETNYGRTAQNATVGHQILTRSSRHPDIQGQDSHRAQGTSNKSRSLMISKLKAEVLAQQEHEAEQMQGLLCARGVSRLVHFTRVENIEGILKAGILPKAKIPHDFIANDRVRLDEFVEALSLSISFPNYRMLSSCRDRAPGSNWAVLSIVPSVPYIKPCLFYPTNAAKKKFRGDAGIDVARRGLAGLSSMFAEEISGLRQQLAIPDFLPTDPQSEILVFEAIEPSLISEIALMERDDVALELIKSRASNITVCVDRMYFGPRKDYGYWRKEVPDDAFGE